jgi:hypothetical protein
MISGPATIFLDFRLPNATSWFYVSWFVAMALFFKFTRILSVRNWDLVSLFLLVPGLLLLQEGHEMRAQAVNAAQLGAATTRIWYGYLWLLGGSAYFMLRCFLDLRLIRRPALSPNLNLSGLGWLSAALAICLIAVALRPQPGSVKIVGREAYPVTATRELLSQQTPAREVAGHDTEFWAGRVLAISCHLFIVIGLIVVGIRHFQNAHAGVAAATCYLLLPYTALQVGQAHLLWLAALVIWAVALYRQPLFSGMLLGLGAGTVYLPALLAPLWFSFYWRRGAGRFAAGFFLAAVLSLTGMGLFLLFQHDLTSLIHTTLKQSDWQAWKFPRTESFWSGIDGSGFHWAYRLPVFIAYLALLVGTTLWPTTKNLAHVIALSVVVLVGVQFWYADQGGALILWYLPLLLLMVFRPNLSDRRPQPIMQETDWLRRVGRVLVRVPVSLLRPPPQPVRVR